MKNVLTKISYMAFGCLLTLIGYHFGNIDNNSVSAQQASEKFTDNIVGKIRVRQLEIVGNDNKPQIILGTTLDGAEIKFVGEDNTVPLRLKTTANERWIVIKNPSGGGVVMDGQGFLVGGPNENLGIQLSATDKHGLVSVYRKTGKSIESLESVVQLVVNDEGQTGIIADIGNESYYPTWTPMEDSEQTVIYKKRTVRTKSLDLDRYKIAPGQTIR